MSIKTLWLRAETKAHERRTPLIPEHAAELLKNGYNVVVEKSADRIFKDEEYQTAGCALVSLGTWIDAPTNAYILGIKELPDSSAPLKHHHIYFAHAYKNQDGAAQILNRFQVGNGLLYDLEFLLDKNKKRVTTFSYWAGVAGCAISLLLWTQKCKNKPYQIPEYYASEPQLIAELQKELAEVDLPSSLVIGAAGRCGRGVKHILSKLKLAQTSWDREETQNVNNYQRIFEHNLLFNCIYLTQKITPFITKEQLDNTGSLSIIGDISCDPTGPNNPLPIYDAITTFKHPTHRVGNLDIMAIDHLPSFLPKESSEDFSTQLLPYLKQLLAENGQSSDAWKQAEGYYREAIA